jgi:flagellar M-ring protein FliF
MSLAQNASAAAARFATLPVTRQIGLMVGLAASVAIGLAVVLWSREPSFMPVYSQMSARDSAEAVEILQRSDIPFKIDPAQGIVMVGADQLQTARMKLAADGLPRGDGGGFDLFAGNNAFNSSQFMENARYKLALENELARTISQFHDIKAARVHLAIPRESAFVRDSKEPSASVFLDVYSGLELKKHTVAAIVNLVASSIPSLSANRVTVVDQYGQLLNEGGGQTVFNDTDRFQDYRQSLEQQYSQKIQDILTPFLGYGRIKAKVSADIDFTSFEQTQELYNPEASVLRSEQTMVEKREAGTGSGAGGVPGALSNKPPTTASLQGGPQAGQANSQMLATSQTNNFEAGAMKSQSTKNFELDKTISHTRNQPGTIKRLSVAVLVDNNRQVLNPETKKMEVKPLTPAEIDQIKLLVSDAVGLNTQRGDSLNVINSNFVSPEPMQSMPAQHFWQTDFFWSIVKQVVGAIFVLLLVFGLLRPLFKTLANGKSEMAAGDAGGRELGHDGRIAMPSADDPEAQLALLRQLVDKEPKRVAQVVKSWVDRG